VASGLVSHVDGADPLKDLLMLLVEDLLGLPLTQIRR
jgi:hypothetical protein